MSERHAGADDRGCKAYIALGSNLDQPVRQVRRGLAALERIPRTERLACSSLYRSAPLGPADQPDYVNAVAALRTRLAPLVLLDALLAIEQAQGRVRGATHWGPRTLDLDILAYGDLELASERLTIPHSALAERAFVLIPLEEIAPELHIPGLGTVAELRGRISGQALARVADAHR